MNTVPKRQAGKEWGGGSAEPGKLPLDTGEKWLSEGVQAAANVDGNGVVGQPKDSNGCGSTFEEPLLNNFGDRVAVERCLKK